MRDFIEKPYIVFDHGNNVPLLLLAEHAGKEFPLGYNNLGLSDDAVQKERNIAGDSGVFSVASLVAAHIGTRAIVGKYSRLLVDLNRTEDDPSLIPQKAHGFEIPDNQDIHAVERQKRVETFYRPFHQEVQHQIDQFISRGICPLLFSIHSFTPDVALSLTSEVNAKAPDIGLLFLEEHKAVTEMRRVLSPQRFVRDNFPYDLRAVSKGSIHVYGDTYKLPIMAVEISIDRLKTSQDEELWARLLADGLQQHLRPSMGQKKRVKSLT